MFLVANTIILARYGLKSGTDDTEQLVNAAVAGSVPIALAMMPFFIMATWTPGAWRELRGRRRWRRGRPNPVVLVGFLLYAVFITFNFMGAVGALATQKTASVDRREGAMDDARRMREARTRKAEELARLRTDRPTATVEADIQGAQIHRFWSATGACREATSKAHSRFCSSVASWKAELGTSREAERLRAEIDDLDRRLSAPAAATTSADPESETIATYASLVMRRPVGPHQVRLVKPLVWFTMLEATSMFFLWLTLTFFRVGAHQLHLDAEPIPIGRRIPAHMPTASALMSEPVALPGALQIEGEDADLQAAVLERFWADCTRPQPSSRVPLTELQVVYRAYCERRRVLPYRTDEFTRRAGDHWGSAIATTGPVTWVMGIVLAEPMGSL